MGVVLAAADAVVAFLWLSVVFACPVLELPMVLPRSLCPALFVEIQWWFAATFDHYVVTDPPPFFHGLVWLNLGFLWPVSVANFYGILAHRRWVTSTTLMAGVYLVTLYTTIFSDMLVCGRATPRLLQLYIPYLGFSVVAVLRGLYSCLVPSTAALSIEPSAQKKIV